jgi:hypothetical protein
LPTSIPQLKAESSSDSHSAKSKGFRLVSAKEEINQKKVQEEKINQGQASWNQRK